MAFLESYACTIKAVCSTIPIDNTSNIESFVEHEIGNVKIGMMEREWEWPETNKRPCVGLLEPLKRTKKPVHQGMRRLVSVRFGKIKTSPIDQFS